MPVPRDTVMSCFTPSRSQTKQNSTMTCPNCHQETFKLERTEQGVIVCTCIECNQSTPLNAAQKT